MEQTIREGRLFERTQTGAKATAGASPEAAAPTKRRSNVPALMRSSDACRPDLPTGTVTFLFTDVEGSTRLLHEHGDALRGRAAEHRRALSERSRAHGGVEVDTQGDAFFFVFARATEAVAAAPRPRRRSRPGPIRVRIGIHTGEPIVTAEGYVGADVHRAARIAAAGHGGQIVLSETTRGLVERRRAPRPRRSPAQGSDRGRAPLSARSRGLPASADARRDVLARGREPAHRARAGGRPSSSPFFERHAADHGHRSGRNGQDAARAPGRRRAGRTHARRCLLGAARRSHRSGARSTRRLRRRSVPATTSLASSRDEELLLVLDNLEHLLDAAPGARRRPRCRARLARPGHQPGAAAGCG